MNLETHLGRLHLKNPIAVASGTFGYAREMAPFVELCKLGAIIPKTVTQQPRIGNAPPRIVETSSGMLNAIGLDNDGLDAFIEHHLPYLRTVGTALIVNIAGKSAEEFPVMAGQLAEQEGIAALELNLSCPNVAGGTNFATNPALARQICEDVRHECPFPIIAKLTPNVTDITVIAQAAADGGADAVSLVNTFVGMAVNWRQRKPILANVTGGLSGPAIKPLALRMVYHVARKVDIPVFGIGGIQSIDDVMDYLVCGARAVQIGTANFYDPGVAGRLVDELEQVCRDEGINHLHEIVGTLPVDAAQQRRIID